MDKYDELFKLTTWDKLTAPFCRAWGRFVDWRENFGWRCQRFRRGYSSRDVWEMRTWFVETLRPMLEDLLIHHTGHPDSLTNEEWEAVLKEMVELLDDMDVWDDSTVSAQKEAAKDRFFVLFSQWFYDLWD